MGLFSRPKCPIHRIEYSIGTNGLEDYYYCQQCRTNAVQERDDKRKRDAEIQELKDKIEELERRFQCH